MKKALLLIVVLAAALAITYLLLHKSSSSDNPEEKDSPLSIVSGSSAFTRSFADVLNDYYKLTDAFVEWDTAAIRTRANKLSACVDSLKLNQLKADTAIIETAVSLAQSITGEISGLNGETGIEEKKREFNMITDMLYNLIRTVRYNGSVVYHMTCPMAFSDSSEGFWLSANSQVVNPYLGKKHPKYKDKMLDCGKVSDSIHFAITP
ncbi:MAG: DUF3347 domain-containing protein [Bacteroidota bacterium]|nr:DUF3347 domain-containing protein [Bacteroidota bacterium]MDP4213493.1 DUF3347 domain-containing protein [Bacteroidota bacterium]MDP4250720.1 DUF3347 domain-containing protein [Bacteroidota bacterium]